MMGVINFPPPAKTLALLGGILISATSCERARAAPHPLSSIQSQVIVAVIDTGVDISHPHLKESIWINPGETGVDQRGRSKASNGIDDDENGYIDDVTGWNFFSHSQDVLDRHGHGTHIAGIIASNVRSLQPGCRAFLRSPAQQKKCSPVKIMPLKFYEPSQRNPNSVKSTVQALRYAVRMGAHVINYSAGGFTRDDEEEAVLQEARNQGIVLIAAAGNESSNSDRTRYFPADYDLSNIISVAAVDTEQRILKSSNFGVRTVDVAAPGKEIWSTLPGGGFGPMSGTSQATAFVSAAAAVSHIETGARGPKLLDLVLKRGSFKSELSKKTKLGLLFQPDSAVILAKDWIDMSKALPQL